MDYQQAGTDAKVIIEQQEIEAELKSLWDKIRKASEVIFMLRDENQHLKSQNSDLQQKYDELNSQIIAKEKEINRIRTEYSKLASSTGEDTFSATEKEALKNRITDLITKINSHL